MGNTCAKDHPGWKHELLNEHSDRYFEKVQARNSIASTKKKWGRRKRSKHDCWAMASLTDKCTASDREEEPTVILSPSVATPSENQASETKGEQLWERRRRRQHKSFGGWQVKRKGNALKLRLAKNRRLQLTASAAPSPLTLDSGIKSGVFNPLHTPMLEELNSEFESLLSSGMVWVELARASRVTAVAMSRTLNDQGPLLLAIGGEDGLITVTQIVDDHNCSDQAESFMLCGDFNARKFGETIEFPQNGRVRSIDFSPDGNYLAVGSDGCTASLVRITLDSDSRSLIDLEVLSQVERIDRVYSVQFSPDSKLLVVGGFDGIVAIVTVESLLSNKDLSMTEISRSGLIFCMDWSPDGSFLAIGGSDKCCAILDTLGNVVREIVRPTSVQTVRWNFDGTFLAVGDRDVVLLESGSFDVKCEIGNIGHSRAGITSRYRVSALCWSPDGSYLAIGGSDNCCLIVECQGYALVHEVRRSGSISCLAWGQQKMPTGDYRRYLSISDDSCKVALLKAGAEMDSDDQSSVASSSYFSTETEWTLQEDTFMDIEDTVPQSPHRSQDRESVTSVAFSRAGNLRTSSYLAFASDDCSITIIATSDWKAVLRMELVRPIRAIAFSNSNNYLAMAGDEGILYVLSVCDRSMILNTTFDAPIRSVSFSRLDERLAVGASDGVLTLLGPEGDWKPIGEIEHSEASVLSQDWSSKNLAIGRDDGSVDIFQTDDLYSNFFLPETELQLQHPVRSVAFGSSGRFLAVGGDGGTVSVFSAKSGWVLCHQLSLGCHINATGWSPSGRYFAFAGKNQTSRVVDTITWEDVGEVKHSLNSMFSSEKEISCSISCIDWSIDGKLVAFGSRGGGIRVVNTSNWQVLTPSHDHLCRTCSSLVESDDEPEEGVTYASF